MADVELAVRWTGTGLEFDARGRAGVDVRIDGNTKTSVSPVETLMVALATCMASDILDIGVKSRLPITSLDVEATGMRNPEPPCAAPPGIRARDHTRPGSIEAPCPAAALRRIAGRDQGGHRRPGAGQRNRDGACRPHL